MVTKISCPLCGGATEIGCPVCHGRGIVRTWSLLVTAEWLPDADTSHLEQPGALPPGVALVGGYEAPLIALRVDRYGLAEALRVAGEALQSPTGQSPLAHRAW